MGVVEGSQRLSAYINNSFPLTSASMLGLWFCTTTNKKCISFCGADMGHLRLYWWTVNGACLMVQSIPSRIYWKLSTSALFNYFLWPVEVWESIFRFSKDCSRIYRAGLTECRQKNWGYDGRPRNKGTRGAGHVVKVSRKYTEQTSCESGSQTLLLSETMALLNIGDYIFHCWDYVFLTRIYTIILSESPSYVFVIICLELHQLFCLGGSLTMSCSVDISIWPL